ATTLRVAAGSRNESRHAQTQPLRAWRPALGTRVSSRKRNHSARGGRLSERESPRANATTPRVAAGSRNESRHAQTQPLRAWRPALGTRVATRKRNHSARGGRLSER